MYSVIPTARFFGPTGTGARLGRVRVVSEPRSPERADRRPALPTPRVPTTTGFRQHLILNRGPDRGRPFRNLRGSPRSPRCALHARRASRGSCAGHCLALGRRDFPSRDTPAEREQCAGALALPAGDASKPTLRPSGPVIDAPDLTTAAPTAAVRREDRRRT